MRGLILPQLQSKLLNSLNRMRKPHNSYACQMVLPRSGFSEDISAQDYYPYGMVMDDRNYQQVVSEGYRYGFNGKELDVETGINSYDFGARILDTRLGRWLSLDRMSQAQPKWSGYKAFNDNPIAFNDPDGNTEFLTIIFKDQHGNSVTFTVKKSDDVMTDGVVLEEEILMGLKEPTQSYYDFETVILYEYNDNGDLVSTSKEVKLLKANGVKDTDYPQLTGYESYGYKKDPDGFNSLDYQESGFHLTCSDGGPSPVQNENGGGESRNIDDLLTVISLFSKDPSQMPDVKEALGPAEFINTMSDLSQNVDQTMANRKLNNQESLSSSEAQAGDSVSIETLKITQSQRKINGRLIPQESHSTGPTVRGVLPQDTVGQFYKGDKSLKITNVRPLQK